MKAFLDIFKLKTNIAGNVTILWSRGSVTEYCGTFKNEALAIDHIEKGLPQFHPMRGNVIRRDPREKFVVRIEKIITPGTIEHVDGIEIR